MRAVEEVRPGEGRGALARIGGAILAAALVAACAGENLFTAPGTGGGLGGPQVDITAPQPNISIAPGDSVNVTATISGTDIVEVSWAGILDEGGAAAFTPVGPVAITAVDDTTMSRYLKRSGTTPGAAKIIVTAKDVLGDTGADTIAVTLGS